MRLGCAALAASVSCVFLGITTSVSAVLVPFTDLTASANAWDERTDGHGCVPDSCHAGLAIDGSIDYHSRWSCKASASMVDACELTLMLAEPQDIVEIRIAFWKGDTRIRELNIFVDGVYVSTIVSSGMTMGYETYELVASQASMVLVQANEPLADNGWLSITGVELMVESDDTLEETSADAAVDENYVGCFADSLDDRVMFTVTTMDDLTPEACQTTCAAMGDSFRYFALQQGNECWCSLCDLTDNDTNTAYERHGEGVCNAACAGDSSMACGGDMAFSLYQNGSCISTPAPTPPLPEISETECPDDSIPPSLEISLVWIEDTDLDLHVTEPGGFEVFYAQRTGDVGIMSPDNLDGPGNETYTLQNGLNIEDDEVLGTYSAWITNGEAGTPWVMTAKIAGELVWVEAGVISEDYLPFEDRTRYNVAVTEYTESTCDIELYGTCPEGTFSEDGTPPCVACDPGDWSDEGSTFCFLTALQWVDASEELLIVMEEDAIGGFAGPGYVELNDGRYIWQHITLDETNGGDLTVTGTFYRYDEAYYYGYDNDMGEPLPPSITLFVYLELNDGSFTRGEGEIDPSTGNFTASVTGIPNGFSTVFYSFVFLDPDDALDSNNAYGSSVFDSEVVNFQCPSPLTITLEWDTDNSDLDMEVTEPDGYSWFAWDVGTYGFGSGDVVDGFGPEIWTVIPGNPDAIGTYTVRLYFLTGIETEWKLTATVNGEVVWIETGVHEGFSDYSYYYFYSSYGESEIYSVTLDSVDTTSGC